MAQDVTEAAQRDRYVILLSSICLQLSLIWTINFSKISSAHHLISTYRAVTTMANELRQLVDTANAPIFGIDVRGNVNEWNDKTAEITGYSKKEAFNKPLVSTFIVEKLRPSVQQVLDNALQGNETSNYKLEFETKSKEIRYLLGE